ncbi:MAG: DnaB-like helicase C-terminal domain-containing protein [Planctomycetota bacterium]
MSEHDRSHVASCQRAVLACLQLFPGTAVDFFANLRPEDFPDPASSEAFRRFWNFYTEHGSLDVTLALQGAPTSATVAAFNATEGSGVTSSRALDYAKALKGASRRVSILRAARTLLGTLSEDDASVDDALAAFDAARVEGLFDAEEEGRSLTPREAAQAAIDYAEDLMRHGGLSTGIKRIDNHVGLMRPAQFWIVAARPSMGKSALATSIALEVAKQDHKVGFFSLETSVPDVVLNILANDGKVDVSDIRRGNPDRALVEKVFTLADNFAEHYGIHINDQLDTTSEICREIRRLKREHDISLVVIDYLGLVEHDGGKASDTKQNEIANISRAFKRLAVDLQIPFLVLCQLSRKVEERVDKRPVLSDLRDSGAIEQDADVVMMIYREGRYDLKVDEHKAEIGVVKNKTKGVGGIELHFEGKYLSFTNGREWERDL